MEELARVALRVVDAVEALGRQEAGDRPEEIEWPSSDDPLVSRLSGALKTDLAHWLPRVEAIRSPRSRRSGLERLAGRFRYFATRLDDLARALDEVRRYEQHVGGLPSLAEMDEQKGASETIVDPHRFQRLLLKRAQIRVQIQLEQIKATLFDHDPRGKLEALRAQADRLELERLLLIQESEEPRRGLDLEIRAAEARIAGDTEAADELRVAAQRAYEEFITLSKRGALAPLVPTAERVARGAPFDPAGLTELAHELYGRLRGWAEGRTVFVAGSTHVGDELAIASALVRSADRLPDPLFLIVVPRLIGRSQGVLEELRPLFGEVVVLRDPEPPDRPDAVVVDVAGLLKHIYSLAHGAFIGGGRSAIRDHNFCEPLAYGIPTLTTPYRQWGPERFDLVRSRAPHLLDVVTDDTLEEGVRRFVDRVVEGRVEAERRERAETFLELAREAEHDALDVLRGLGEDRVVWLEKIREAGWEAWRECPHREEFLELGLLLGPSVEELRRVTGSEVRPAKLTGITSYLLDRLRASEGANGG